MSTFVWPGKLLNKHYLLVVFFGKIQFFFLNAKINIFHMNITCTLLHNFYSLFFFFFFFAICFQTGTIAGKHSGAFTLYRARFPLGNGYEHNRAEKRINLPLTSFI